MDHRQVRFCEGLTPHPPSDTTPSDLAQLQTLFQVAAFWAQDRAVEDLGIAIAHSHPIISVWNHDTLIGFARATSDGIYRATIWDVVIHPDYRSAGLGRQLVQTLLAHPHLNRVETFYERIGFEVNANSTLVLRQENAQAIASLVTEASQATP
jgi:ribosomal protein S18 acetylase RimI-like enzyme